MLRRVPLSFDAVGGYFVDLPVYRMMPGTFEPLRDGVVGVDGPLVDADPVAVLDLPCTVLVEDFDMLPVSSDGAVDEGLFSRRFPRFEVRPGSLVDVLQSEDREV